MKYLFYAHSGLRYLVLLAGLVALVYFAIGLAKRWPVGAAQRAIGSAFVGLLDLQIVLGIALMATGVYYPALIGHIVLVVIGAAAAHGTFIANRRRAQPGWVLPWAGVVLALAFIAGGIMAIGRLPWASNALGPMLS